MCSREERPEHLMFGRGWKWAHDLASKMGRYNSCPLALEGTFVFKFKLEQFDNDRDKDLFVLGYREYHKQNRSIG